MTEMPEFKTFSVELELLGVNPDLIDVLTGAVEVRGVSVFSSPDRPNFSADAWIPIRRRWWEWLLRRPRQYRYVFLPNVVISTDEEDR